MDEKLLLGIDTCGPTGSVALARLRGGAVEILGEERLEGRQYSALLTGAVERLRASAGIELNALGGLVVVHGPGSFTGVRVGVSSAMGLAEGLGLRVVAVSRLETLAAKAGVAAAALDAHRNEVYLRLAPGRELLAGAKELAAAVPPVRVAVCEEGAARLLAAAWPGSELVRVEAPAAGDALGVGAARLETAVDPMQLDGHYLRRSDAEIFGEKKAERV